MLTAYLEYIFFFTMIFISVMTYYNWKNTKAVLFLFSFFLIYMFENLMISYSVFGVRHSFYPVLFYNFSSLYLLKAPFFFFFIRKVFDVDFKLKWYDGLHFVPFLYKFFDNLQYIFTPYSYKVQMSQLMIENYRVLPDLNLFTLFPAQYELLFRNVQLLTYLGFSIHFILKGVAFTNLNSSSFKHLKNWNLLITLVLFFLTIINIFFNILYALNRSDIYYSNLSVEMIYNIGVFTYISIPFIFVSFPKVIYGIAISDFYKRPNSPSKQIVLSNTIKADELFHWNEIVEKKILELDASISDQKRNEIVDNCNKIFNYLDAHKPYLNPDFQMIDLSKALNLPKHHIQSILNDILNIKFTDLKNEYRVRTAVNLLKKDKNLSLEGIGAKSGFASNSNFYSSFKSIMNQTPSQWLKENLDTE